MGRARSRSKLAVAALVAVLAATLAGAIPVAAATFGFTLQSPSVSTVAYSDMVTFNGTYTCVNDAVSNCPTTGQSRTATFSLRPSGGSAFTTVGTVTNPSLVFTSNPAGCVEACSRPFTLPWRSGRIGNATVAPGVYDIGLTTTIAPGQLVLLGALTIEREATTTTYQGLLTGEGNTNLALTGSVLDHDRGTASGTGIISPDGNLVGAGVVTFELYDGTNTLRSGPVSASLNNFGVMNASAPLPLPAAGGTFELRTTYAGNGFYLGSTDVDVITVAPSNLPPTLTLPTEAVEEEATSEDGAAVVFAVSASDPEDEPDPVPNCSPPSGVTFPVGETLVTCSVLDSGGLSDTDTFTVRVFDTTDPFVAISTEEEPGSSGWFNIASNDGEDGVTVDVTTGDLVGVTDLACTDIGVDVGPLAPTGGSFVLSDGEHAVECTATDAAGNEDTDTATFKVDQTAPSITSSVGPAPAASDWWNAATGAPTARFDCSDATSRVATCGDPFTFGEGADLSTTGTATDAAGNTATADVTGIDVDLTGPVDVAFTGGGLVDGGQYAYLFVPASPTGCTSSDALSGPATCGVSGYADTVGTHAILGSATDVAGNTGTGSLDYEVLAWMLAGFNKPIDMTGFNSLRAGGTAQLKFEVVAGSVQLTSLDVVVSVDEAQVDCGSDAPKPKKGGGGAGGGGSATSIEASAGGRFTVRWQSPDQPGTCWRVTVRTLDGSSLSATFTLR